MGGTNVGTAVGGAAVGSALMYVTGVRTQGAHDATATHSSPPARTTTASSLKEVSPVMG